MLNNSTVLFLFACLVLVGVLYLLYKAYQKKKRKPLFIQQEPEIFNPLGENERSSSRNEHFVFPEKNNPMKEQTLNKFKVSQNEKTEIEQTKTEIKKNKKHQNHKEPANQIEKLKKEYKGEHKNDRGFIFDAENAILSHEILKKKENKNKH